MSLVEYSTSRLLASKRIIAEQFNEKKFCALVSEFALVSTLDHPSFVAFAGVAWSSPFDFQILCEYMPNGDLRSHLERTSHPGAWTRNKLRMALEIAEGLVDVHSFSPAVVHRDLKARNILLDNEMHTKISDFGISRLQSENGTMSTGVGTSRWLAPEVITGGGLYTEQRDIYLFGVLLVEIDTHASPFAELAGSISEFKLLQRVARGEVRPQLSSTCDCHVASLVERCLSTNPSDRPNALEVAFDLRRRVKEIHV